MVNVDAITNVRLVHRYLLIGEYIKFCGTRKQKVIYKRKFFKIQWQNIKNDLGLDQKYLSDRWGVEPRFAYQVGAVAFDAVGAGNTSSGATSLSWSHTSTGSDLAGLTMCSLNGADVVDHSTGMTWGGNAGSRTARATNSTSGIQTAVYQILGQPSGAQTVALSFDSSAYGLSAQSISFTGATGFSGATTVNDQSANTSSINITSSNGGMTVDFIGGQGGATYSVSGSNTERYNSAVGAGGVRMISTIPGTGGTNTHSWSLTVSKQTQVVGVNVTGVATAATAPFRRMLIGIG